MAPSHTRDEAAGRGDLCDPSFLWITRPPAMAARPARLFVYRGSGPPDGVAPLDCRGVTAPQSFRLKTRSRRTIPGTGARSRPLPSFPSASASSKWTAVFRSGRCRRTCSRLIFPSNNSGHTPAQEFARGRQRSGLEHGGIFYRFNNSQQFAPHVGPFTKSRVMHARGTKYQSKRVVLRNRSPDGR